MALDPVTAISQVVDKVLGAVLPDKAAKDAAAAQLNAMIVQGELASIAGQIDVDKTEAANSSTFVAGWRPFIGWVCGAALVSDFMVRPLCTWIAALAGHVIAYPALDMGTLLTLLVGMLGLGGMRTAEKLNGVNSGH